MQFPNSWFGGLPSTFIAGSFGSAVELTISGGVAAKTSNAKNLTIDTEGDAASDDLDNVTGYSAGDMVVISPANGARTVVVKDSADLNLQGVDFSMNDVYDSMILLNLGSNKWKELSRSAN